MKKFSIMVTVFVLSMFLFAGIASAHVTVQPTETTQGSYEVFTLRVPSEKEAPTVKVEVKIPAEVNITRFEPKPGWKYELTKDSAGKITSVVWSATGEGLSSTEFGDFKMNGKVADSATQIAWKAYQTYKDGSVVEWIGAAGSDKPASVTKVNPKAAATAEGTEAHQNPAPLYLSIAALVLGLASVVISLMKKRTAA